MILGTFNETQYDHPPTSKLKKWLMRNWRSILPSLMLSKSQYWYLKFSFYVHCMWQSWAKRCLCPLHNSPDLTKSHCYTCYINVVWRIPKPPCIRCSVWENILITHDNKLNKIRQEPWTNKQTEMQWSGELYLGPQTSQKTCLY